jgi:CheY-like chemotaxis protein
MSRILVVEDSPDIRELMRLLLEADGHEVELAGDGGAAMEAVRAHAPDLVLMDLSLPVVSGWETARQLKAAPETAAIPIVAVTAHAMQGDRERALAAGCDGFLAKPIDEDRFAAEVASFLPAPAPATARARRRERPPAAPPGRILVVDDHPEVAEFLRTDLAEDGHLVRVATSAAEARSLLESGEAFDLAIVDVMLGSETGYELTAHIASSREEYLPVLLLTAGTIDRQRAYEAGADDFIGKPIDSVELRVRAQSLLRVGRLVREHGRIGREREEAYARLVELDRLKSDFLSTVSHELRTPLNTILLLAHLLERRGDADPDQRLRDLRVIRESAETLLRMINNILDLAKLEARQSEIRPSRFALRGLIEEAVDVMEPQARARGIALEAEIDSALPYTAVLDREKVLRVLINLLSNAVKFTPQGRVVLRSRPFQSSLTFEVQDTGRGIPPHLVPAVFEPFRSIRPAHGDEPRGTGLGLPICKQLVELMGGDIALESREGQGTRVTVTVPQLPETAGPEPPDAGAVYAGSGGVRGRRLLVVEDDPASRYGLRELLDTEGFEVVAVGTLSEADARLAADGCDGIILDVTLPDGDGAQWLANRRASGTATPPVIVLTGATSDADRRRIEENDVAAVLHKPVSLGALFDALSRCLSPAS